MIKKSSNENSIVYKALESIIKTAQPVQTQQPAQPPIQPQQTNPQRGGEGSDIIGIIQGMIAKKQQPTPEIVFNELNRRKGPFRPDQASVLKEQIQSELQKQLSQNTGAARTGW